jgi:hypothetical protein
MMEHEEFLADVRARLEQAQATQKKYYDLNHRQVSYQVGDWRSLVYDSARRLHYRRPPVASSNPAIVGRTASPSSSTTSPFASPCPSAPASTTCSTSVS